LSHIGNEVHYRFLRTRISRNPTVQEVNAAVASRKDRCREIDASSAEDGYVRHVFPDTPEFDVPKGSYSRFVEECKTNASTRPRCGLCMSEMLGAAEDRERASPSSCVHEFCRQCLIIWTTFASKSCPTCDSCCTEVVDFFKKSVEAVQSNDTAGNCLNNQLSYWAWTEFESFNLSRDRAESPSQNQIVKITELKTIELIEMLREIVSGEEAATAEADIEVISIVLTPKDEESTLYSNKVSVDRPNQTKVMYIVNDEVYLEALKTLNVFNDRMDSVLPFMRVGLPKLFLWMISCEYIRQYQNFTNMLDIIVSLIMHWSKTCGLSSHTAFRNYVSSLKITKAPTQKKKTNKVQKIENTTKKPTTQISIKRTCNKRKSICTKATPVLTRAKLRKVTNTETELETILYHKRARGKRKIKPTQRYS